MQALAKAMHADLGCPTPADALDESAGHTPRLSGISHRFTSVHFAGAGINRRTSAHEDGPTGALSTK